MTVLGRYFESIPDKGGNAQPGLLVRVLVATGSRSVGDLVATGAGTLATLLTSAGATGPANPTTVDANGDLGFYADAGLSYDLLIDAVLTGQAPSAGVTWVVFATDERVKPLAGAFDVAGAASAAQSAAVSTAAADASAKASAAQAAAIAAAATDATSKVGVETSRATAAEATKRPLDNLRTVTGATTAAVYDYILADTTGGTFAVTAPAVGTAGAHWGLKWKVGTTPPTLIGTFNGSPTFTVLDQAMEFISDGSAWYRAVRPSLGQLPDYPVLSDTRYPLASSVLVGWFLADSYALTTITRDANEAITTATVVWPDGGTGTFTTDTKSAAFPGAIDAYHATYVVGGVTKTVTQALMTRDSAGAVIAQPTPTVA